jgi:transcriptional regulator with XRE-family HTH domain
MTLAEKLGKALAQAEDGVDYWRDIAVTDFTRDLHARMKALGISQGELARRMGTSRPYVTKLLEGGNFTLQTMVKLATALDAVVRIRLEGREQRVAEQQAEQQNVSQEAAEAHNEVGTVYSGPVRRLPEGGSLHLKRGSVP